MTTNKEVMSEISKLSEKIDKLSILLDNLNNNSSITLNELEVASAKIISDISEKIEALSSKMDTGHSNKDILDAIENISITASKSRRNYKGLTKFSPPSITPKISEKNKTLSITNFSDKR